MMRTDALMARDKARADLKRAEEEFAEAKAERDRERRELKSLSEERRKQYEATEKRLRLATASGSRKEATPEVPEEVQVKMTT